MTKPDLDALCRSLGYRFNDWSLLKEALTHRSAEGPNNERLEFLGDSVLNFVIAAELFDRFPKCREGELSRLRASLVNQDTLAQLAGRLDLGVYLYLGGGERKAGGFRRASILADALEAIFGAVYRDGGFEQVRVLVSDLYTDALHRAGDLGPSKDYKTQLQEFLQARGEPLPEYGVVGVSGVAHEQEFKVSCKVSALAEVITGTGGSRRKAEQDAARRVLAVLRDAG